jgi:hypothetical protein
MVETRPNVKPETISVGAQAWVGTAWFVAAQGSANVADVHTGRQPFDDLIGLGDDSLLYA